MFLVTIILNIIFMTVFISISFYYLSKRKKTESALKESEEKLKTLMNSSQFGICMYKNQKIIMANATLENLCGYTTEEYGDKFIWEIFHPDYQKMIRELSQARQLEDLPPTHYQARIITRDQKEKWVDIYAQNIWHKGERAGVASFVDISDRKMTEEAFKESEKKFMDVFYHSPDAIVILEGIYLSDCNQAAVDLFLYPDKSKMIGVHPSDISPEIQADGQSSLEKANQKISELYEKGSIRFEWLHKKYTGETFIAEVTLTNVLLKGKPLIYSIVKDITEKVKAKEELHLYRNHLENIVNERTGELEKLNRELSKEMSYRIEKEKRLLESEARQSLILRSLPMAFYISPINGTGKNLWVSEQIFKISGFTTKNFEEQTELWSSRIHPDDKSKVLKNYDYILKKGNIEIEYRWKISNGKYKWFLDQAVLIRDEYDQPKEIIGIWLDITDQKHDKERLEYRFKMEHMVTTISKKFINLSSDELDSEICHSLELICRFIHADRSGILLLSKDKSEISITHEWASDDSLSVINMFQNMNPDDYPWLFSQLSKLKFIHIPDVDNLPVEARSLGETIKKSKVKSAIYIPMIIRNELIGFLYITTIKSKSSWRGEDISMFQTVVDIFSSAFTRKWNEKEAEFHRRQLIEADKMISLGILVAGVAHEINNPNNFIMMNAPILERSWNDIAGIIETHYRKNDDFPIAGIPYSEMRENIPELFKGIRDGSERIKQIVLNLKGYARQDNADMNQTVSVNEALKASITLLGNPLKRHTHHLKVKYGENLPPVKGNFQRIEQVLINIILNACQALPNPSKGIFISTSYDERAAENRIEIIDEGEGISKETLKHIQDPFFTTKRDSGGTGLGLSISAGIIKEHFGNLHFSSEQGKGTTVIITLPVSLHEK